MSSSTTTAQLVSFLLLLNILCYFFFFFFSSRRRHTRFSRDWSSDVCSSARPNRSRPHLSAGRPGAAPRCAHPPPEASFRPGESRSEERRVGKHRRSGMGREQGRRKEEKRGEETRCKRHKRL